MVIDSFRLLFNTQTASKVKQSTLNVIVSLSGRSYVILINVRRTALLFNVADKTIDTHFYIFWSTIADNHHSFLVLVLPRCSPLLVDEVISRSNKT